MFGAENETTGRGIESQIARLKRELAAQTNNSYDATRFVDMD